MQKDKPQNSQIPCRQSCVHQDLELLKTLWTVILMVMVPITFFLYREQSPLNSCL